MLRIKTLFVAALVAVAAVMVGCESEGATSNGGTPVVTLERTTLNVDGNGGDMMIYYSVENAVKGVELEVSSRVDWVEVKSVKNSTIVLSISKNMTAIPRETLVEVDYEGIERTLFVIIKQDQAILDMFSFEVSDVTYNSCKVRYIPSDDNILYMANIIDKEFFSYSGITTEEAFIETEMKNYIRIAEEYGMTLAELMSNVNPQLVYRGEAMRAFSGMQHSGKYVIYSYGVIFDQNNYEITTPVHYTLVELPMPSMYDVKFSLQASWSASGSATLSVDPGDWNGYYSIQIAPEDSLYYSPQGGPISALTIRSLANAFFNNARTSMAQGVSPEMFLASTCYKGFGQYPLALDGNKRYMIIVFAVESEDGAIPVMRSIPTVVYI